MSHRLSLRTAAPLEGLGSNPTVEDLHPGHGGRCRERFGRIRCRFPVSVRVLLSFSCVLMCALAAAFCYWKCDFSCLCFVILLNMLTKHVAHAVGPRGTSRAVGIVVLLCHNSLESTHYLCSITCIHDHHNGSCLMALLTLKNHQLGH